ncbi:MAG: hypothetical protein PHW76_02515 [Alphaproteobacteria bacterium]|nr:hypothetical protein [Alphaproteobacteria bacterium]
MGVATRHLRTEREATAETLKIGPAIVTRCGEAGVTRDFALFNANSNKIDPRALEEFRDPVCTCGDEPVLAAVQQKPEGLDARVTQVQRPTAHTTALPGQSGPAIV